MAKLIADELGGEMDVVLVRKISAPGSPEFAIGSVDESGWTYIADYAESAGATAEYIEREKQTQLATMRKREEARYPVAGKRVLMVDDMIDTGRTIASAAALLKQQGAKSIT
ncbi:MAG: phosphoribosyltransferase, partial [Gammaproteobacteria bacterium]|nr:phosphoribosyltransferase [Gammaproteobacteria bacterium]